MTENYVLPLPDPYLEKLNTHRFLIRIATVVEDLYCQIDGRDSETNTRHYPLRVYLMRAINSTSQSISFDALQSLKKSLLANSNRLLCTLTKPSSTN